MAHGPDKFSVQCDVFAIFCFTKFIAYYNNVDLEVTLC